MLKWLPALILPSLFAVVATAQEVSQSVRMYWLECDANRACIADINGFSATNSFLTFKLERSILPNAPVLVTVVPEHDMPEGARIGFDIPGVAGGISGVAGYIGPDNSTSFAEPVDSALVDAIRRGTSLTVTVDHGGSLGSQAYTVPLAGAVDALTIMDVVQQRLGRVDAAVARGAQPAESMSDLYPSEGEEMGGEDMGGIAGSDDESGDTHMEEGPNGSYVDLLYSESDLPDEVLMPGYRVADCGDLSGPLNEVGALLNRDQTARKTWLVPCKIGKANVAYYVVMHDPANGIHYEFFEFQLPPGHNKPDRMLVLNPVWLPDSNTMILTRHANINLNCGAYETHAWVPEGRYFELVEYREKKHCSGPQISPENFPVAWTIAEMGD